MAAKRILIINNRVPYPLNDGGNIAVQTMIEGYRNAGWQVYLLAMNTTRHLVDGDKLKSIYNNIHAFETVDLDNRLRPFAVARNFFLSDLPNHADRFFDKNFEEKLLAVIKTFAPDVIQVENIFLSGYLPAIKKATNAITILRLHNIEYQLWERVAEEATSRLKQYYLHNLASRMKKYEEQAWGKYDLLLPIAATDATVVKATGIDTDKILTTPTGIDVSCVWTYGCESKEWKGYHIGAMDWLPNAEGMKWFLNKVWPQLHKAFPQFMFHFAGRNMPEYFKTKQWPNVNCDGEVADAGSFIADKNILYVPIHSGGGLRIKILEAMAKGKLVISTATGIQGIDAVAGKHYLLANTEGEFLKATTWVMENHEAASNIGKNAKELIRIVYDNEVIMGKLIFKVNNLLKKSIVQ